MYFSCLKALIIVVIDNPICNANRHSGLEPREKGELYVEESALTSFRLGFYLRFNEASDVDMCSVNLKFPFATQRSAFPVATLCSDTCTLPFYIAFVVELLVIANLRHVLIYLASLCTIMVPVQIALVHMTHRW